MTTIGVSGRVWESDRRVLLIDIDKGDTLSPGLTIICKFSDNRDKLLSSSFALGIGFVLPLATYIPVIIAIVFRVKNKMKEKKA